MARTEFTVTVGTCAGIATLTGMMALWVTLFSNMG